MAGDPDRKAAQVGGLKKGLPGGIRARLYLLIALALLPVLLLLGWIYYQRYETRRVHELQTQLEVAQGVAATFAAYLEGVQQQNNAVGQAVLSFAPGTEAEITRLLVVSAARYPTIRNLSWVSPDGMVLASSLPGLVGRDLSFRAYFQQILAGRSWAIGDMTPQGVATQSPTLALATAIRDDRSALRGAVVAGIEPKRLGELVLTQQRPAGGSYSVFDSQGVLAYHFPEPSLTWEDRTRWKESDSVLRRVLDTGQPQAGIVNLEQYESERMAARVPVAGTGWVAGASRPVEVALAPVRRGLLQDGLLALLVFALAFLLASLLARTIDRPLRRLERDALDMGAGELETPGDLQAPTEVRRLRSTVEGMATGLIQRAEALQESENALRESNDRILQILESISDAFYSLDQNWCFTYINQKAAGLWGMTSEGLLGKNIWEIFPAGKETESYRMMQQAVEGRLRLQYESYSKFLDQWVNINLYPTDQGLSVYFQDITERKRAEQALRASEVKHRELAEALEVERAKLAAAIDSLPVGVGMSDAEGNTLSLNAAGLKLHGFQSEAEMFYRLEQYIHEFELCYIDGRVMPVEEWPASRALRGEFVRDYELRLRNKLNNSERILSYSAAPVRNSLGEIVLIMYVMQDMTERKQAGQALRESEARFRHLADSMPQLVWTAQPDGTVDYYNRRVYEYDGIFPAAGEAWEWAPVLHPEDVQPTVLAWKSSVETGEVYQCEHRVRMSGGEYRWHLSRGVPLHGSQGEILKWYGTATDIHEQKLAWEELRKSREKLRRTLESITDAYIAYDDRWRFIEINSAAEREFFSPRTAGEMLGKVIWEVYPDFVGGEAYRQYHRAVETGQPVHFELQAKVSQEHWYEIHAFPRDGRLEVYHRNINERKQAEQALRDHSQQLERSNRNLQEFAFMASHDLQEPLRKIEIFGDAVLQRASNLDERQRDYLVRMRRAADRMRGMIDGLLQYSLSTASGRRFEPVALTQTVAAVLADLEDQIRMEGGCVEAGPLPVVEADPAQMRRLFHNLIGNALKFHRPGVPPEIRVYAKFPQVPPSSPEFPSRPGPERTLGNSGELEYVEIVVQDNGIGFDNRSTGRLFQPFQRLGGRSEDYGAESGGSGMGLAICRRIVEHHGGEITARGEPGQGATFTIRLPLKAARAFRTTQKDFSINRRLRRRNQKSKIKNQDREQFLE